MEMIEKLEQRISNLEAAIVGLGGMLQETQPPETRAAIDEMLRDLFDCNSLLGGYRRACIDVQS